MGAGIAHALLLAGSSVQLVERDSDAARAAVARVRRAVDASVARGLLEFASKAMTQLVAATSFADLATVGLVVEAVPEDLDLKVTTLRAVEDMLSADAVIASNTSSISLATLGNSLTHPERLLGLHFFNPVPASKLVEIVIADRTTPQLRDTAVCWVKQLGKTPVVVRDTPGFASSRLGVLLGLEAIRMVEQGVASAEDIDAAMTLGYGHPVGPLRLTDLVGLDVRLGIARYLEQELGPQFRPPDLLVELVERGDLGQKTGRGFYAWDEEGQR
jgi:3-hydroxybutyryl-CoA dehydrogenase